VPSIVKVLQVVDTPTPTSAIIDVCQIDAGVVVEPLADGSEIIVNDLTTRYDTRSEVEFVDGTWRTLGGGESLSELPGVETCD
jgi:hypothetical protein